MAIAEPTHDANIVVSNSIVARLAGKICGFDKTMLTKKALAQARIAILDTVGVTLAGVPEPCTQILLKTPGIATAPGSSLIFGTDRRTSALDAALVNGTAAHTRDDLNGAPGQHSASLVPMLFALAEERKGRGDDLIAAYVIGVETEIRLARAINLQQSDKDWHSTSALGTFAAAAAASHFLKLGPERTAMALSVAASLAGWVNAGFGAMTKSLHAGQCGRNGLLAVLLAEQGLDTPADVFEQGVFSGPGALDPERLFADWVVPRAIETATSPSEQWDKFEDRAARALPREQIAALVERLETFDKVTEMSQVTRLLQTSALHRPQVKKVVFAARGEHEAEETTWVP